MSILRYFALWPSDRRSQVFLHSFTENFTERFILQVVYIFCTLKKCLILRIIYFLIFFTECIVICQARLLNTLPIFYLIKNLLTQVILFALIYRTLNFPTQCHLTWSHCSRDFWNEKLKNGSDVVDTGRYLQVSDVLISFLCYQCYYYSRIGVLVEQGNFIYLSMPVVARKNLRITLISPASTGSRFTSRNTHPRSYRRVAKSTPLMHSTSDHSTKKTPRASRLVRSHHNYGFDELRCLPEPF